MADYEVAVSKGLWPDIEQSLPKAKSKPLWFRWISVAAVVAIAIGTGLWLWPEKPQIPEKSQPSAQTASPEHQLPPIQPEQHEIAQQQTAAFQRRQEPQQALQMPRQPQQEPQHREQEAPAPLPIPQMPTQPAPSTHAVTSLRPEQELLQQPILSTKKRRNVTVGLHANGSLLAYSHSNGVRMNAQGAQYYNNMSSTRSAGNEVVMLAGYKERQHHSHPISFGLTLNYGLTERWSLQTGLVYTRLSSDFQNIIRLTRINKEQTLHYAGIPLGVQYQVLGGKQWNTYATANVQLDWNVRAKTEVEGVEVNQQKDRLQWSAGAAVGLQYNPLPSLGLYVEPGLRYYFDNGSKVQNYFKELPTNWSLQLGLRLSLCK